jgi:uncharacterized membrane protein
MRRLALWLHPHPAEVLLVAALVVFGTAFALLIPLGAGWDEETHLVRVWDLAHLRLLPNEATRHELPYPAIYWDLSYRRQLLVRPVDPGFWSAFGTAPIDSQGYLYAGATTRSFYSPPSLLPYALVMRYLGLKLELPALVVFYASRLAGLAAYTLLAWLAVRLTPFGKWTLAALALAPTAVFQAATISADPASTGLAMLFVAGSLAVAARTKLGWKEVCSLVALAAGLFWGKGNLAVLAILPFLLVKPSQFRMRGGYWILAAAIALVAVVEVGLWTTVAYSEVLPLGQDPSATSGAAPIATGPLDFIRLLFGGLWANGTIYLQQWIGEYGYGYGSVPLLAHLAFGAALLSAILADQPSGLVDKRTRAALVLTFLASAAGTFLALYIAVTPAGADQIEGVQGRYFTPLAPLLGLAVVASLRVRQALKARAVAAASIATSLVSFGVGLQLSYHVICGTAYYAPGLCYLPVYKNWAPNERFTLPLAPDEVLTQEVLVECDGLSEIRVWVDGSGLPAEGRTRVVFRDPSTDRDLAQQTVANPDLPQGGWLALPFETEWPSTGKLYLLTLRTADSTGSEGARIALTILEESPEVKLRGNPAYEGADAVFRYGCADGLARAFPSLAVPIDPGD